MNKYYYILSIILLGAFISCSSNKKEALIIDYFESYYQELAKKSDEKWLYTKDTVKIWYDDKKGTPLLSIKSQKKKSKWSDWDKEMNSKTTYDSIWYDEHQNAVKGYFYEQNDFYKLIGKPPTKTLRTYWFDDNYKISEMLIYWIPEANKTSNIYLKPIKVWALKNDSLEIETIYPNNKIVPSKENAIRWKKLLKKFNQSNHKLKD